MSEVDDLVKRAASACKAGHKKEARELLMQAIQQDDRHEQAWLWMSVVAESLEERQICLENVLTLNPGNEQARKGLEAVNRQIAVQGGQPSAPPAAPTSSPPSPPRSSSAPIGAEFEAASGDSVFDEPAGAPVSPFGDDFDAGDTAADDSMDWLGAADEQGVQAEPDPFASSTSADWGGEKGGTAYHGSGAEADLPSAQEYDDWVEGLNLGAGTPDAPGADAPSAPEPEPDSAFPFGDDEEAPFGDSSFMVDDSAPVDASPFAPDTARASPAAEPADPFADDVFGAETDPWGGEDTAFVADDQSAFSGEQPAVFEDQGMGASSAPFETGAEADDSLFSDEDDDFAEDGLVFATDDPADEVTTDWLDDEFDQADKQTATTSASSGGAARQAATQDYYRYIPDDIQAAAGAFDRQALLLLGSILVLLVLNAASFAFLLM